MRLKFRKAAPTVCLELWAYIVFHVYVYVLCLCIYIHIL